MFVLEAPASVVLVITFVPDIAPFITKPVKLPSDVTLGCAAVCNVPVILVDVKSVKPLPT